jgi:hypothetical protein
VRQDDRLTPWVRAHENTHKGEQQLQLPLDGRCRVLVCPVVRDEKVPALAVCELEAGRLACGREPKHGLSRRIDLDHEEDKSGGDDDERCSREHHDHKRHVNVQAWSERLRLQLKGALQHEHDACRREESEQLVTNAAVGSCVHLQQERAKRHKSRDEELQRATWLQERKKADEDELLANGHQLPPR